MEKYKFINIRYWTMYKCDAHFLDIKDKTLWEDPPQYLYSKDICEIYNKVLGGEYTIKDSIISKYMINNQLKEDSSGVLLFKTDSDEIETTSYVNIKRVNPCPYQVGDIVRVNLLNERPWNLAGDDKDLVPYFEEYNYPKEAKIEVILNDYFIFIEKIRDGSIGGTPFHWWDFMPVDNPDFVRVPIIKTSMSQQNKPSRGACIIR